MSMTPIRGVAAGVPFVALPPRAGAGAPGLVVAWHLMDPPRSPDAFAGTLPLADLPAWRVYLELPLHGSRAPAGGPEAFFQLVVSDAVSNVLEPIVEQAAAEFPAVLADLRERFSVRDGPLGLLGGSIGAAVAQLVLAEGDLPVRAAALVSPVVQLRGMVEVNERMFGMPYTWTAESTAAADRIDFLARVADITRRDAAMLIVTGEDDAAFREPAETLHKLLADGSTNCSLVCVPAMGHALADEPGVEPDRPNAAAVRVDAAVTQWFRRHLVS
ncbi:MAG TPA: prolyl oligopeptidase family serine peptidase [Catenuloplanes sp.]|jgi:dienelactone hydrolase